MTPPRALLRRAGPWLLALAALGVIAFQTGRVLRVERSITGGEICLPLDDSFIYLQYAKAIAEGRPFVYTPGNAPTTGATSLLYPLLLVPPHLLRLGPSMAIAWAVALGVAGLLLSTLLLLRLGRLLGGWPTAALSAAFFLLSPHLLWGYLSGMEIALYATVLLATLLAYFRERGSARFRATHAWLFALAAARPEGAVLAGVLGLAMLADARRAARAPAGPRFPRPSLALPFLAAALPFLVCLAVTGSIESTSAQAKSILAEPHPDTRAEYVRGSPGVWLDIAKVYLSWFTQAQEAQGPGFHVDPRLAVATAAGLLLFALLLLAPRRGPRPGGGVLLALLAAGVVVNSLPIYWYVHLYRYQQGLFPVLLLCAAAGYGRLARLARERLPRSLGAVAAAAAIAAPLAAVAPPLLAEQRRVVEFYGWNCENILHQQVKTGRWIDANLPPGAVIALNDAGAIAYYGHRTTLDLIGLTTAGFARVYRSGIGCLYESVRRLPPGRLPTYFVVYPEWFPYLRASGLLGPAAFQARLSFNTICGGDEMDVYPAVWIDTRATDRPALPAPELEGRRLVDSIDLAWLDDEARHDWRVEPLWRDVLRSYAYAAYPTRPITDGGRIIHGGERFRASVTPGKDLVMVMRTDAWFPSRLRVSVDGRPAGTWAIALSESAWVEPRFRVPGALLTRPRPEFHIEREGYDPARFRAGSQGGAGGASSAAGQNYAPFHYWFYQ